MGADKLKLITLFSTGLDNGYYGNRVAHVFGDETFAYDQSGDVFANSTSTTKTIRDNDGTGYTVNCDINPTLIRIN